MTSMAISRVLHPGMLMPHPHDGLAVHFRGELKVERVERLVRLMEHLLSATGTIDNEDFKENFFPMFARDGLRAGFFPKWPGWLSCSIEVESKAKQYPDGPAVKVALHDGGALSVLFGMKLEDIYSIFNQPRFNGGSIDYLRKLLREHKP